MVKSMQKSRRFAVVQREKHRDEMREREIREREERRDKREGREEI